MEKRWRNLVVLVVVLAAGLAGYLYFSGGGNDAQQLDEQTRLGGQRLSQLPLDYASTKRFSEPDITQVMDALRRAQVAGSEAQQLKSLLLEKAFLVSSLNEVNQRMQGITFSESDDMAVVCGKAAELTTAYADLELLSARVNSFVQQANAFGEQTGILFADTGQRFLPPQVSDDVFNVNEGCKLFA